MQASLTACNFFYIIVVDDSEYIMITGTVFAQYPTGTVFAQYPTVFAQYPTHTVTPVVCSCLTGTVFAQCPTHTVTPVELSRVCQAVVSMLNRKGNRI